MAVGNSFNKSLMAGLASGAGAGIGGALGGAGAAASGTAGSSLGTGVGGAANVFGTGGQGILSQGLTKAGTAGINVGATELGSLAGTATQRAATAGGNALYGNLAETATQRAATAGGNALYGNLGKIPGQQLVGGVPGQQLTGAEIYKAAGPMEKLSLMKQGAGAEFASPEAAMNFAGNNKGKLIALGTGVVGSNLADPQPLRAPLPEKSDYAGPYMPTPRTTRFPIGPQSLEDTSEFQYFSDINPYPGYIAYDPKKKTTTAADGGLMGLAGGGSYDDEAGHDGYAAGGTISTPDMHAIQNYVQSISQPQQQMAMGGMTSLARGGSYLDGPGDGLSDSIHATIGNNQPARLADGEFVISADVVSDIGGGSSKAGAKKLHAMMDRVRQSAHGTKKQVKKLNDRKVLAA
jgi:hypothetical protein